MDIFDRQNQVGRFLALAFGISWTSWLLAAIMPSFEAPLKIAGTFGPSSAALILVWPHLQERRELLSRLVRWRIPINVLLYASALPVAGILLALLTVRAITGNGAVWPEPMLIWFPVVVFAYIMAFSVVGEELGWRGLALPPLIARHGPIKASLGLGLVWAIWHAPLFLLPGDFHNAIPPFLFAIQIVASSVIYTHLHLASGGSLVPAHLFHASFNASAGLFPVLPQTRSGDLTALWFAVGTLCVIAVATVFVIRRRVRLSASQ